MQRLLQLTLCALLVAAGIPAWGPPGAEAEERAVLDFSRFSAGPRALAQLYDLDDGGRQFDFVLGAAAAWNVTSRWDLNGSLERALLAGELVPPNWRASAGTHVQLPFSSDTQQWFLGFERAWYRYSGEDAWDDGQWVVRLQWSFGAQTASGRDWAFAIVRGRYDVSDEEQGGRRDYAVGVQPQLIGGH